jgi:hypothetical protein
MSGLRQLTGSPLHGAGSGGGGPILSPSLAVVDHGDGTGATGTIGNSTAGTTNKIYSGNIVLGTQHIAWALRGTRTGNGPIAFAINAGFHWFYVESHVSNSYNVSEIVNARIMPRNDALQAIWDATLGGTNVGSTAEQITNTNLSMPRLRLMDLLAACPSFRSICGETTSEGAMLHIHSPYALEVMEDGASLATRPRAMINHNEFSRELLGTEFGGSNGSLFIDMEVLAPPAANSDPHRELTSCEELFGKIITEMEERRGHDKVPGVGGGVGEAVMTPDDESHLNFTKATVVAGPASNYEEEESGERFYGVTIIVEYV